MASADPGVTIRHPKRERKMFENPLTWWGDTSYGWNFKLPMWTGSGEMEALCELFFDNLATLLGVTGSAVGHIGYGIIGSQDVGPEGYPIAVASAWEDIYFNKHIPGAAFALLFGNVWYSWMAGRLAAKEDRLDVTAQPYGMNTTGIFITLYTVSLGALFDGLFKYIPDGPDGIDAAAQNAAMYAWKVSVTGNFIMGLFEMSGFFLGDLIRWALPTCAVFVPLTGVGFVWLAFSPILDIVAEPMMCFLPFMIVVAGFFGYVRYPMFKIKGHVITFPVALMAILVSVIIGWAGGCKHYGEGAERYGYDTCQGTDGPTAKLYYEQYAFKPSILSGVGTGLGGFAHVAPYLATIFLVAASGFLATMTCVESAELAGDAYPMCETMIIDGLGTCIGAIFGSFYSTTVYIGHPAHKMLGAKRGYSFVNGCLYFFLLLSGLFAPLYAVIPKCANGAILTFVGLLLARQAFEESPPRHYPALILGIFPFIANWAKLDMPNNQGVKMIGPAGGIIVGLVLTALTAWVIDRKFKQATIGAIIGIPLSIFGFFASHNSEFEKIGIYGKDEDGLNNGWRWSIAFALCVGYFALNWLLQHFGIIEAPIPEGEDLGDTEAYKEGIERYKVRAHAAAPRAGAERRRRTDTAAADLPRREGRARGGGARPDHGHGGGPRACGEVERERDRPLKHP